MKIAVCFSGQLERITKFPEHFANQLLKLAAYDHCDLFFSHWDIGVPKEHFTFYVNNVLQTKKPNPWSVVGVEFTELYQFSSKLSQADCWSPGNSPKSIFLMFGGVRNADLLRQAHEKRQHFKYDLVVRSRLDIDLAGVIDLAKWKQVLDTRKLTIFPKNFNWFELWTDQGMLNDQCFIASSDVMTSVTSLVDHIDEYVEAGCRFHPESLLWWHIKKGIPPPLFKIGPYPWDKFVWYSFQDFETVLRGSTGW